MGVAGVGVAGVGAVGCGTTGAAGTAGAGFVGFGLTGAELVGGLSPVEPPVLPPPVLPPIVPALPLAAGLAGLTTVAAGGLEAGVVSEVSSNMPDMWIGGAISIVSTRRLPLRVAVTAVIDGEVMVRVPSWITTFPTAR